VEQAFSLPLDFTGVGQAKPPVLPFSNPRISVVAAVLRGGTSGLGSSPRTFHPVSRSSGAMRLRSRGSFVLRITEWWSSTWCRFVFAG